MFCEDAPRPATTAGVVPSYRSPHVQKRSMFWPAGPITARHTKNREWLLPANNPADITWAKSGPPTHEVRLQKGEPVPPLLDGPSEATRSLPCTRQPTCDATSHAKLAGKAICDLRRDLNGLVGPKGERSAANTVSTLLLKPAATPRQRMANSADPTPRPAKQSDEGDISDDELWEALGATSDVPYAVIKKRTTRQLVANRCLDSVTPQGIGSKGRNIWSKIEAVEQALHETQSGKTERPATELRNELALLRAELPREFEMDAATEEAAAAQRRQRNQDAARQRIGTAMANRELGEIRVAYQVGVIHKLEEPELDGIKKALAVLEQEEVATAEEKKRVKQQKKEEERKLRKECEARDGPWMSSMD